MTPSIPKIILVKFTLFSPVLTTLTKLVGWRRPHKMASPESEIYWNYLKCRWISLKSLSVLPISRILKSENLDMNWYTKIHVLLYCDLREWNLKRMWCLFDVTFDLIFQKPLKYNFSKIFHLNMACVYIIWEKYMPHIFVLTN